MARLFELEVPEVEDGLVEVKSIARDAGDRSKVAVHSNEQGLDPVGTCVGIRGSRVRAIVEELNGEKVELIQWNSDPTIFVRNALQPAKISRATLSDTEESVVKVIVPDDQLSLAIGKRGQNVRLSARLTSHRIDIVSESESVDQLKAEMASVFANHVKKDEVSDLKDDPITSIDGVGPKTAEILTAAGYATASDVTNASIDDLANLDGIGAKTAKRIYESAEALKAESD